MTVARTAYETDNADGSKSRASAFAGATANIPFSVTTSTDTTACIPLGGLIPWRLANESGGSATLTFYDAMTKNGTALAVYDQDSAAIGAITIGDDCSHELPSSLAGCTWLVIKGAGAADGFTLICKR
jgi:hypothetical protein